MNAIEEQARSIVRDLDEIKDLVCADGGTTWAIAARLIETKRAAARLAEGAVPESAIMTGYQADVHGELKALHSLIELQGCGFLVLNRRALQMVMLAAENFAERARSYLSLVEQQEEAERRLEQSGGVIRSLAERREDHDAA